MNHAPNIRAVYDSATEVQRQRGIAWYREVYDQMFDLSREYLVTVEQAAAVFARVSPRNSYGTNLTLARQILHLHSNGVTLRRGYLSAGLDGAARVLAGEDPRTVLTSDKVRAFFECIVSAGDTDHVCVDRHAYSLAWNQRSFTNDVRITKSGYRRIADAFREVAAEVGLPAAQVQATAWLTWRDRYWAPGAWDRPAVLTVANG